MTLVDVSRFAVRKHLNPAARDCSAFGMDLRDRPGAAKVTEYYALDVSTNADIVGPLCALPHLGCHNVTWRFPRLSNWFESKRDRCQSA